MDRLDSQQAAEITIVAALTLNGENHGRPKTDKYNIIYICTINILRVQFKCIISYTTDIAQQFVCLDRNASVWLIGSEFKTQYENCFKNLHEGAELLT